MAIFASFAIYPFVYGFPHRPVRKEIYTTVRSIFGYGPSHSATLPRRWSISSHIMDYLPTTGASRSHSRRTSADDVLGQHHRRRRSSTSEESDTVSDTSFFHTFLRSGRASRRRETAPSILQNCVQQPEPAGIVLNLTKTAPGSTGPDV
ncbi:hypothetical protein BV898_13857 [Hypsibius exemplaris]|uniref:Uncharacterized protein n=1 Tax=Hypsibius exemplaris TaxID=2072580 RepID=A0A1W0W9P1_HYPEX|nr:hypothetical protein BV898_13857 [Hypsibius exemplaris]